MEKSYGLAELHSPRHSFPLRGEADPFSQPDARNIRADQIHTVVLLDQPLGSE